MTGLCQDRVVIVTGAGRGIGRGHAIEFARQGAKVVVNDIGAGVDGSGSSDGPTGEVVDEIRAAGGHAIANGDDVSDWEGAKHLVDSAVEAFGTLDVLVNNAGILRDRMLVNMSIEEWDAVIRVHLRGTFATMHWAAGYWRDRSKAGEDVDARIINTSSSSGIYGNVGQTNYGAAKAGIAAMTIISSMELARYGITVNAVAPGALTRMTENLDQVRKPQPGPTASLSAGDTDPTEGFDPRDPDNIAPVVVWLASSEARGVTGRMFNVRGGHISVAEGWVEGPVVDNDTRWDPHDLGGIIPDLVARAAANANMRGERP